MSLNMDCQFCFKNVSRDTEIHLKHLKSHHPFEMSYKCIFPNCLRKFQRFFALKKHIKECSYRIYESEPVCNEIIENNPSLSTREIIFKDTLSENSSLSDANSSNKIDILESDDIRNCVLNLS